MPSQLSWQQQRGTLRNGQQGAWVGNPSATARAHCLPRDIWANCLPRATRQTPFFFLLSQSHVIMQGARAATCTGPRRPCAAIRPPTDDVTRSGGAEQPCTACTPRSEPSVKSPSICAHNSSGRKLEGGGRPSHVFREAGGRRPQPSQRAARGGFPDRVSREGARRKPEVAGSGDRKCVLPASAAVPRGLRRRHQPFTHLPRRLGTPAVCCARKTWKRHPFSTSTHMLIPRCSCRTANSDNNGGKKWGGNPHAESGTHGALIN